MISFMLSMIHQFVHSDLFLAQLLGLMALKVDGENPKIFKDSLVTNNVSSVLRKVHPVYRNSTM